MLLYHDLQFIHYFNDLCMGKLYTDFRQRCEIINLISHKLDKGYAIPTHVIRAQK